MKDIYLYHYLFDATSDLINSILKNGLLPVDKLPTKWARLHLPQYYARGGKEYFKKTYQKFFQKALGGKKYINYGVYLTPINLWGLGLRFKGERVDEFPRIEIPLKEIDLKSCVLSEKLKRRVRKVPTERIIRNSIKRWTKEKTIKTWKTSKLRFIKIPQIAYFSKEPLPVTKNMIKYFN